MGRSLYGPFFTRYRTGFQHNKYTKSAYRLKWGCRAVNRTEGVRAVEAMNLTVALTGASGAVFGRELLRALEADERVGRVHFVASENSLRVLAEELGLSGRN